MNHKRTVFGWIRYIKKLSIIQVISFILTLMLIQNAVFAGIYNLFSLVENAEKYIDYLYFSFVTSFTVGYGEMLFYSVPGKILGILHIVISALTFSISISMITAKLLYPKDTLIFSDKILYDENGVIHFRVINIHREAIINPEIRVYLTAHCVGNVIAPSISLAKFDSIPALGKHDYCLSFDDLNSKNPNDEDGAVMNQYNKAVAYNKYNDSQDSRFRIIVSISGHNGMQQISEIKKYYASDFHNGKHFKPIEYTEEDQKRWGNLNYKKIPGIWEDFNTIIE